MAVINKRIFDTDNALKGSFNGLCGKWQMLTYACFVFAYAIIIGWMNKLHDFTLLSPSTIDCDYSNLLYNQTFANQSLIQRLSGKSKNLIPNSSVVFSYNHSNEFGSTVVTEYDIYCDLKGFVKTPRYSHYLGYIIGALILGFASDRGGRKMIILACIWTTGVMSLFQLVGHDFVSYIFFQFFIGLFIGGVQASFLPAIIEMFPINFRTFYGVFFHLVVCLFELLLPWLSKSFKSWQLLQVFVTVPILLTAVLQWFVSESIFWYLAHKEYDKAIRVLTKLAKRNGIEFESKFKQAKDFLHAKHSKATQVDILPLLRLQDVDVLGKKYPQVDMAELQKQKSNSSKLRRFLNSLKGESYRSTNTIYRAFDFIYSPTLFVYVLILSGLWLTNGLTESMESIKKPEIYDVYVNATVSNLSLVLSSTIAIVLAIFKIGRRWMIFLAYLVIELCLLISLITSLNIYDETDDLNITLSIVYHLCKFSSHFGLIFLMLITAELFPTSLRCSGMGICFTLKMIGSAISSPHLMDYNSTKPRLLYCILTLFFGSMTLFLPETKTFPLPRSILQIEAMPTAIGKKLRSRKVKYACERRQTQLAETNAQSHLNNQRANNEDKYPNQEGLLNPKLVFTSASANNSVRQNESANQSGNQALLGGKGFNGKPGSGDDNSLDELSNQYGSYDTVTSVHDIGQDDHHYYSEKKDVSQQQPLLTYERKLGKIMEVPSKNITRNNSISDVSDVANSKV